MLVTPKPSCTFFMLAQMLPVFLLLKYEHQRFLYPSADIRYILYIQKVKEN